MPFKQDYFFVNKFNNQVEVETNESIINIKENEELNLIVILIFIK